MARKKKGRARTVALLILVLVAGVGYLLWPAADPDGKGEKIFYDRIWIDKLPERSTDQMELLVAVTEEPRAGIFSRSSSWHGVWDVFLHEAKGDGAIRVRYPHTGKSEKVKYRAWRCDTGGFDFCLEIGGASRGAKRYYSIEGWELEGITSPGALHDAAMKKVAADVTD